VIGARGATGTHSSQIKTRRVEMTLNQ